MRVLADTARFDVAQPDHDLVGAISHPQPPFIRKLVGDDARRGRLRPIRPVPLQAVVQKIERRVGWRAVDDFGLPFVIAVRHEAQLQRRANRLRGLAPQGGDVAR